MKTQHGSISVTLILCALSFAGAEDSIQLANSPALSPNGKRLAFAWRGDIWMVTSGGGVARQVTTHRAKEGQPAFSPDGKQLAFISDRTGANQLFVVPVEGGAPKQLTFHSEGCGLEEWYPDGESLLITADRDHYWRHSGRFFKVSQAARSAEHPIFDAYGRNGRLSPDESRLLFTREGERWWRKGYRGSRASQVWMYDFESKEFQQLVANETESRSPMWGPDGKAFYYVGGQSGSFNLWRHDLESGDEEQLTDFSNDSVVMPCISRDGSTIVFRHLFDFYRFRPGKDAKPRQLKIRFRGAALGEPTQRRTLDSASSASFTKDGLEVAFATGGDIWVMDTELREPRQITDTPEEEREPLFSPDGESILFVSDSGGECDVWTATREDAEAYWWQNDGFRLQRLTQDAEVEANLQWSPTSELVSFVRERGDLWVMKPDGKDARRLLKSWNEPDYDWSPDGKWIVYTVSDSDFNRDVQIMPIDGSREPFNLSRHPDNDYGPVWSPDGKMIAFRGRRVGTEVDIYYVYLRAEQSEETARDRKLAKAIEKIQKVRKGNSEKSAKGDDGSESGGKQDASEDQNEKEDKPESGDADAEDSKSELPEVVIDFEGIHDRIRRVSVPDAVEVGLFWSHDSKKLAFTATIDGKRGTYTIEPPDDLAPKLLSSETGSGARWLSQGNQIVWLSKGVPGTLSSGGKSTAFSFSARQTVDLPGKHEAVFDQCWRAMRDRYYDGRFNNRNWDAIRRKYAAQARSAVDVATLSDVVHLMLGELNGSHLGFRPGRTGSSQGDSWRETTAHFGLRFDSDHKGPGLLVRDVIPDGPADKVSSKIHTGETVLSIDDRAVDPDMDLTTVLNGSLSRNIVLKVRDKEGTDRDVTLRPISFSSARSLLYEKWVKDNQQAVDKASDGKLGYLHIRGMNMTSFYRFESELYSVAAGKDGIIIDVRENGGGSTTDHLLTVLTQPAHAITVPRGGSRGYPHDRKVYASWKKPIVVMCNQNSFSNAEIFSHAIKTLERGQVVGVPTAGGVISTGGTSIMDMGFLRMPFRGWFLLNDGEDMELNGAVPHHVLWPEPGELPAGTDRQLEKAIEVLQQDVEKWKRRPQPKLRKASERELDS